MSRLFFQGESARWPAPGSQASRMIYTAKDDIGHLYTIGLDITGSNGVASVYDLNSSETRYYKTWSGHRIHADDVKRHLQRVADQLASGVSV